MTPFTPLFEIFHVLGHDKGFEDISSQIMGVQLIRRPQFQKGAQQAGVVKVEIRLFNQSFFEVAMVGTKQDFQASHRHIPETRPSPRWFFPTVWGRSPI